MFISWKGRPRTAPIISGEHLLGVGHPRNTCSPKKECYPYVGWKTARVGVSSELVIVTQQPAQRAFTQSW